MGNDCPAKTPTEWYSHYKSIEVEDLAAELISATLRPNRKASWPMKMAAVERLDELEALFEDE